jgi:hypothetical protein
VARLRRPGIEGGGEFAWDRSCFEWFIEMPHLLNVTNKTCAEFISVSNPYETLKRVQGDKKELRHTLLGERARGYEKKSLILSSNLNSK